MGEIIDFIMENITFVVIAIGVIISIFSSGAKKKKSGGSTMPPFGGDSGSGFDREPVPLPVAREGRHTAPSMGRRAVTPAEEYPARVPLAEPFYHTYAERGVIEDSTAEHEVSSAAVGGANRSSARSGLRPTKHTVVQGVLWGEILGPPRAKKKHIR
jgi:hypothetical protein